MTKGDKVVSMKQNSRISYQNGNQIYLEIFEKGAKDKCLCYAKGPLELKGFDSNMVGDVNTHKSTNGYVYNLSGIYIIFITFCHRHYVNMHKWPKSYLSIRIGPKFHIMR